jgi:predicted RNase H-like nuclease
MEATDVRTADARMAGVYRLPCFEALLSGAAAAANEVQRACQHDRDDDEQHVEHGVPFRWKTG